MAPQTMNTTMFASFKVYSQSHPQYQKAKFGSGIAKMRLFTSEQVALQHQDSQMLNDDSFICIDQDWLDEVKKQDEANGTTFTGYKEGEGWYSQNGRYLGKYKDEAIGDDDYTYNVQECTVIQKTDADGEPYFVIDLVNRKVILTETEFDQVCK